VSLGLPVYNGAEYVGAALDSLLRQTYGDFEIVISDNASTDETEKVCREYERRDPRIRYSRNDRNRGVAYNFRKVFELSTGQYFKWVVHDDVCDPSYVEKCVEVLDAAPPQVVLCYPKTILIDAQGKEIEPYEDRMDLRQRRPSERLAHLYRYLHLCHCGLGLIRSEVLRKTRGIDGFERSDVVLLVELALAGHFYEHPEYLYFRRVHPQNSFQAYTSAAAYDERMDPANRGRYAMPRTQLFVESLRSIGRAPIGSWEQLCCAAALLRVWGPRYWRVVGGECKGLLRHLARGGSLRAPAAPHGGEGSPPDALSA
jgi:glycosyltransferase involved in cell wall biosynthesis